VIEEAERRENYGVYDGLHFRMDGFKKLVVDRLKAGDIWPPTDGGMLSTTDDTFKEMTPRFPKLRRLWQCVKTERLMRNFNLPIDSDGCNRPFLNPFGSITGRNQPIGTVFAPTKWVRTMIQPPPGEGVAYLDWTSQEIAIMAALSGDERMIAAYQSGDPHIGFAIDAGFVPARSTKETHPKERALCKSLNFGLGYGQGPKGLAVKSGVDDARAYYIVNSHRRTYPTFHRWRQEQVNRLAIPGTVCRTPLGWRWQTAGVTNPRTMMNFPMQSTGADMMRLAAIAGTEAGIDICTPVHDAFLIRAPLERLDDDIERMRLIMEAAGEEQRSRAHA
jgi:hypothetical protein